MQIQKFNSTEDLKVALAGEYRKQIENFFSDKQKALEFLSNVMESVRRTPKLLECTPESLINSFMIMASLKLMPSGVSGEAYVLPYDNRKNIGTKENPKWVVVTEAQFQLGYKGEVTLLYRAGNKSVVAEVFRKSDVFKVVNSHIIHEVDPFKTKSERGEVVGAYSIIETANGGLIEKYMHIKDIIEYAQKFSKSYSSKYSPWQGDGDPEDWMARKTVLRQNSKLAPKNEDLSRAIAYDNEDSKMSDRIKQARGESLSLPLGNLIQNHAKEKESEENQDQGDSTTGTQVID